MQDFQKTIEQFVDYLKGMWIKKRYVMICSWIICPIGFAYVASLPDVFESKARVFVDTRSVLQPLLRGLAIQTNPEQELQMMVTTLLSRQNLETIARESDLDIATTNSNQYESLLKSLASNIEIKSVGRENLYTISYSNKSAQMAKTVVQETLDLLVEGTLGNSRKGTDSAGKFLDEQVAEYEQRLSEAEHKLADFKRKHSDLLPGEGTFFQQVQDMKTNLEKTRLTIKETEQQIKALQGQFGSPSDSTDDFSVRQSNSANSLTTRYDERIKTLEETLDKLKLRYTELHPDVIETQSLLDNLLEMRKKEIDTYLSSSESKNGSRNLDTLSTELRLEVSRLQSLVASLKVRETDYLNRLEDSKEKLDLVPQIEAESTALNRDYGITRQNYEALLSRRESAALSQKADASSEDVQFRIIEPPQAPSSPSGPKRILLYMAVLILGFGAGLGLAFVISQISPVLVRGNQLTQMTSYPLLGVVSHMNREQIKKTNRTRLYIFLSSSGVILLMFTILVSFELLHVNLYARIF